MVWKVKLVEVIRLRFSGRRPAKDPASENSSGLDTGVLSDSKLGVLTKGIKETEENICTRIRRLLAKESDKRRKSFGCSRCSLNH